MRYRAVYNPDGDGWGAMTDAISAEELAEKMERGLSRDIEDVVAFEIPPELEGASSRDQFKKGRRLRVSIEVKVRVSR